MNKNKHYIDDPNTWLAKLTAERQGQETNIIEKALQWIPADQVLLRNKGLTIANNLLTLKLDNETLAAAILYPSIQANPALQEAIAEHLSEPIAKLLQDVLQIQTLAKFTSDHHYHQSQHIENLRKLILAMVSDVRAIIIILAERIYQLHEIKNYPINQQSSFAKETVAIYAPLANRLGIWQFKWEIEDLCLRYLQPCIYMTLAKQLAERRQSREVYVEEMITLVDKKLQQFGMSHHQINGRVKHIYSIYKKMQRKDADFTAIYDITALRVLVETIDDCYRVLSILTHAWQQVPQEFDDYIAHPKENGYQSIHVIIIGPENKNVEIQIRTHDMHHTSELGVAAHWRYKEGILQTSHYEAKIALLRQLMAWQHEVSDHNKPATQKIQDIFNDYLYVFTPLGDVIELPRDATPLDFAYTIHSEVGHRCRGAKVNGNIVALTSALQTGDSVEILTAKIAKPSRDWLNNHLGYLKTSRARSKVQQWFKLQTERLSFNEPIIAVKNKSTHHANKHKGKETPAKKSPSIQISGINHLLTQVALCCHPIPCDEIIGYMTRMRGIRIHKTSCRYIKPLTLNKSPRLINVHWESDAIHQKN